MSNVSDIQYISLFSGIGGLEHKTISPLLFCEQDSSCQIVLQSRHPGVEIIGDIRALLSPPNAEIVVGGWPCQDLSSAGTLGGITASRSGLFFEMVRVAKESGAHTIIGENVPNLLSINQGKDFEIVLKTLIENGFNYISWRILNARNFGLPQERRRLFIVASKQRERAQALHAAIPQFGTSSIDSQAYGFYWTGGKRSICFCTGYVPTLKIGSTDERGRAPVAVMYGNHVRKLSPSEFLRLQGFTDIDSKVIAPSIQLRMAGNAVSVPVGQFVVDAVFEPREMDGDMTTFGYIGQSGFWDDGLPWGIEHSEMPKACNLHEFIDTDSKDSLSAQAAAGLIVRAARSGQPMPKELFDNLWTLSRNRSEKIKASRANSLEALDQMDEEIRLYRDTLLSITDYE